MEIIVLGGAGDMGSRAVEDLAASPGVRRVTIADRNISAAREIAAKLAGQGAAVDARYIDANNHRELVEAMRGYDVAASALGPFHLFEVKLVRAAIEAGVHYASICDEWEAAGAVIDQYGEEARRKGITIITGLGTSPGLSNAGVRYWAQQLDRIQRADIYVYQPLNAGGGQAVVRHMLHIISGRVVAWRNHQRVMIPACHEERLVEFPRFGRIKVWNMGHSEPETIPRFIPDIEEVNFFMGFGPGSGFFIYPARWGLFGSRRIRDAVAQAVSFIERATSGQEPEEGAVRIDVWGEVNGAEVHRLACGIGQMREATGLSLSIGTQMLARGELLTEQGGVYAPEACLDPQTFIARLNARGIKAYQDLEMTQEIA
ncbi:MAG: saccharopine dehydrogenase NADP-binding domain-containing protein [Anaerolineae bacterium]|jgi:saccharopine dehydrogenase-like NADP-dependent oxidoreductase|nr:saccharopine dehydrogenase NADP-binding domain-containing protein [Anaerolineae bacterium]MDH7473236.1 saccharopine dehydrogenase NADP-binding domain-containing protein [Anaerolineae bacterium]